MAVNKARTSHKQTTFSNLGRNLNTWAFGPIAEAARGHQTDVLHNSEASPLVIPLVIQTKYLANILHDSKPNPVVAIFHRFPEIVLRSTGMAAAAGVAESRWQRYFG